MAKIVVQSYCRSHSILPNVFHFSQFRAKILVVLSPSRGLFPSYHVLHCSTAQSTAHHISPSAQEKNHQYDLLSFPTQYFKARERKEKKKRNFSTPLPPFFAILRKQQPRKAAAAAAAAAAPILSSSSSPSSPSILQYRRLCGKWGVGREGSPSAEAEAEAGSLGRGRLWS